MLVSPNYLYDLRINSKFLLARNSDFFFFPCAGNKFADFEFLYLTFWAQNKNIKIAILTVTNLMASAFA